MKAEMKTWFLKGMGFAAGCCIFMAMTLLIANSITKFNAGDELDASTMNQNFEISAPEGLIAAFYLSGCPSGWAQADGNNGTPDLRGAFIRGLNSFDGGATSNTRDPEDTGARSIGHFQTDAFQGHRHQFNQYNVSNLFMTNGGSPISIDTTSVASTTDPINDGTNGTPLTASETRPRNVALIFCMRKNT